MKSIPSLLSRKSTIYLSDVKNICHISAVSENTIWVNDYHLIQQVDDKGKVIREIKDIFLDMPWSGKHSVTLSGGLIYIDNEKKFIEERKNHVKTLETYGSKVTLYSTDMKPGCLYSSHINGDILIGVTNVRYSFVFSNVETGKVIRCDSTGKEIQEIEFKHQDQIERLYGYPRYITENRINGDILVSDLSRGALVVVDKSGRHRFNYRGDLPSERLFDPGAVCTDNRGRILITHRHYDSSYIASETCISLLDQDGNIITRLLEDYLRVKSCMALCVDDENNMYVGWKNVIDVYKLSDSP